jgi:hypothetical protein
VREAKHAVVPTRKPRCAGMQVVICASLVMRFAAATEHPNRQRLLSAAGSVDQNQMRAKGRSPENP